MSVIAGAALAAAAALGANGPAARPCVPLNCFARREMTAILLLNRLRLSGSPSGNPSKVFLIRSQHGEAGRPGKDRLIRDTDEKPMLHHTGDDIEQIGQQFRIWNSSRTRNPQ